MEKSQKEEILCILAEGEAALRAAVAEISQTAATPIFEKKTFGEIENSFALTRGPDGLRLKAWNSK